MVNVLFIVLVPAAYRPSERVPAGGEAAPGLAGTSGGAGHGAAAGPQHPLQGLARTDATARWPAQESGAAAQESGAAAPRRLADEVLLFVKERQAAGQVEYLSMSVVLNGRAQWARIEFSCDDALAEHLVVALGKLGVGGHGTGAGVVTVVPMVLQRLGSRPKKLPVRVPPAAVVPAPGVDAVATGSNAQPCLTPGPPERKSLPDDRGSGNGSGNGGDDDDDDGDDEEETQDPVAFDAAARPSTFTFKDASQEFKDTIKSRIAMDRVVSLINNGATFSFDYVMFVVIASILALIGLVVNSSVVIVASMLVSPLMGPILAVTFGSATSDRNLIKKGLFGECFGILAAVLIGFIGAMCAAPVVGHQLPTAEMVSRSLLSGLIAGVAIAIPSGMGVALSVLGDNSGSLVGVAISASLLPPAVNTGALLALGMLVGLGYSGVDHITIEYLEQVSGNIYSGGHGEKQEHLPGNIMVQGALVSLSLTLLNIVCIWASAIFLFNIKAAAPAFDGVGVDVSWAHNFNGLKVFNRKVQAGSKSSLAEARQLNEVLKDFVHFRDKKHGPRNHLVRSSELMEMHEFLGQRDLLSTSSLGDDGKHDIAVPSTPSASTPSSYAASDRFDPLQQDKGAV